VSGSCCEVTDRAFTESEARAEARNYRRNGPPRQTSEILAFIQSLGLQNASLLDIGGGVGIIHHELLEDVANAATHVDASSAYLREARAESARRGHADRVTFVHGDFTDVAVDLAPADIVTLDRVVCCYPEHRKLLDAAARRSRRVLVMSYPRERWYVRLALGLLNAFQSLRRDPFRAFLHPTQEIDRVLGDNGMRRVFQRRFLVWEVAAYERAVP